MIFFMREGPSDVVVLMAGVSHHAAGAAGVFAQLPGGDKGQAHYHYCQAGLSPSGTWWFHLVRVSRKQLRQVWGNLRGCP